MTQKTEKAAQLKHVADEVRDFDASPLYTFRKEQKYKPVAGTGNPDARVMFVGEAPGKQEAESGLPFVGNAGRVLDQLLDAIGLKRQDVFITSVLKDRPPENRDPHADEIAAYTPFLLRQIRIIEPEVIATLGRIALDVLLSTYDLPQQGQKISELHGQPIEVETDYGGATLLPLYHPAATFYNRGLEESMQQDFKILKQLLRGEKAARYGHRSR